MNTLMQIAFAVLAIFIAWRIYKVIQANPELLSRENMQKSLTTMGVLALILIGGIAILVLLVKR